MGNTIYGSVNGIGVGSEVIAQDNLVYDNSGDGIYYTLSPPTAITGNTIYGNAIGISGAEYYTGPTIAITGNLIYQNVTAGIALIGGPTSRSSTTRSTSRREPPSRSPARAAPIPPRPRTTIVENNILAVAGGPALTIAPTAESRLVSDYNFFDLTGTGAIASWESASYASLASWYYATGLDQHSQVGNPDFVDPAGPDGILGFSSQPGTTEVMTAGSASGFATTGVWTAYTGGYRRRRRHRAANRGRIGRHGDLDVQRPDPGSDLPGRGELAVELHHARSQ